MTYELITKHDSPNYSPRSIYGHHSETPTGITIHHWGERGQQFQNVVDFLCRKGGNTSAHVVCEAGRVAWIVDATQAAWHTGSTIGNGTTIGIELRPEATAGDYTTAAELIRDIRAEYGDLPLYPHRHWFNTACPGIWDLTKLDRMARATPTPKAETMAITDADATKIADAILNRIVTRDDGKGTNTLKWFLASEKTARDEIINATQAGRK